MQPLDYRGWLQQDPSKAWALDYVGNDYNNGKGGAGYSGSLNDMQVASNLAALTGNNNAVNNYNRYNTINSYATEYGNYLNGQGNKQAAVVDPNAAARAAQKNQLQSQLGQLDRQQEIGLGNIGNSYNQSANRLDEQNAVAQRNYETQGQQNSRSYLNTRNGIQQNARATNNSLQRLLGLNGSGYSSAALEQAPYATALQASQQLTGAQQTYGNNASALDTNWQDTQRSYKNSKSDLDNQKYQQENGLRSSIAQTRASLLDRIQQADGSNAYQSQINDLLGQITGFGQQYANPVMRVSDIKFNAPDMGQYSLDKFAGAGNQQQGGAQSDLSPSFLGLLADQRRDEYGNLIG